MELHRQAVPDRQIIQSYRKGRFRVAGIAFTGPVIVTPTRTVTWSAVSAPDLSADALAQLLAEAAGLDVCLLGCGTHMAPVPDTLRAALKAAGLSVDPMGTAAACRTFNVLVAEGRAVVAALIAV